MEHGYRPGLFTQRVAAHRGAPLSKRQLARLKRRLTSHDPTEESRGPWAAKNSCAYGSTVRRALQNLPARRSPAQLPRIILGEVSRAARRRYEPCCRGPHPKL
jgi:hypothetical protein